MVLVSQGYAWLLERNRVLNLHASWHSFIQVSDSAVYPAKFTAAGISDYHIWPRYFTDETTRTQKVACFVDSTRCGRTGMKTCAFWLPVRWAFHVVPSATLEAVRVALFCTLCAVSASEAEKNWIFIFSNKRLMNYPHVYQKSNIKKQENYSDLYECRHLFTHSFIQQHLLAAFCLPHW